MTLIPATKTLQATDIPTYSYALKNANINGQMPTPQVSGGDLRITGASFDNNGNATEYTVYDENYGEFLYKENCSEAYTRQEDETKIYEELWTDLDNDGDVDLYTCTINDKETGQTHEYFFDNEGNIEYNFYDYQPDTTFRQDYDIDAQNNTTRYIGGCIYYKDENIVQHFEDKNNDGIFETFFKPFK